MKIKASDLRAGQAIHVEYGEPGNWVKFTIREVVPFEKMVIIRCHTKIIQEEFSWGLNELVEVME